MNSTSSSNEPFLLDDFKSSTADSSNNKEIDEECVPREHNSFPLSAQQFDTLNTNIADIDEHTQAANVYRKYLQLIKNNESILAALESNLTLSSQPPSIESDTTRMYGSLDKGSKSNLLKSESKSDFEFISMDSSAILITNSISLHDVISQPHITHDGQVLTCLNTTLPVLSYVDGDYFLNTVIEDLDSTTTVARLEITCSTNEAARFSLFLKNPYMHAMNPNSVLLIKNPSFKHDSSTKFLCICAKTANDVVFRDHGPLTGNKSREKVNDAYLPRHITQSSNEKMTNATDANHAVRDEWRDLGDDYSVRRMYLQALFAYNIAQRFDPDSKELAAARGASLISLGLFFAALKTVDSVLHNDPYNTGLILRKTHCLWGLGKLDEAIEYLKTCLEATFSVENQSFDQDLIRKSMLLQKTISKTEKLLKRRETLELLDEEMFLQNQTHLFHYEPEYYTPIRIIQNPDPSGCDNCEKITVVAESMSAGQVLAITKAFCAVIQEEETETSPVNACHALINKIKQKLVIENPAECEFYLPYNGDPTSYENTAEIPLQDAVNLCKRFLYKSSTYHKTGIESTVESSSYNNVATFSRSTIQGVWTLPANIRHACVGGNAIWYICGNVMFIRAICNISAGEEVIMAHVNPMKPLECRTEFLQERGIHCMCPLCQFERSESEMTKAKRNELLKERLSFQLLNDSGIKETNYSELQRLKLRLEDLETLRSAYSKLNFPIVEPLCSMGLYLMKAGNFEGAISAFERAFYVVDNTASIFILADLSFLLSYCYIAKSKNSDKNRSKKWFNAMKSYVKLSYGCFSPVKNKFKEEFGFLRRKGITL